MRNRVVITGMGTVNPCGTNVDELAENLGKPAVAPAKRESHHDGESFEFYEQALPEVDLRQKLKNRLEETGISGYRINKSSDASILAQLALLEALKGKKISDNGRIIVGTNNVANFRNDHEAGPTGLTRYLGSDIPGDINRNLNVRWPVRSVEATCATGAAAIIDAVAHIRAGMETRVFVIGVDINNSFTSRAMGVARNPVNTTSSCIPLDENSGGFVGAEGASAALILEDYEQVCNEGRSGEILGEIIGMGESNNGRNNHDKTDPSVDGIAAAIRKSLIDCDIAADKIDLIFGHLTGTRKGDRAEIDALSKVFCHFLHISSLKGHTGHTLAAAGIINVIASILAFRGEIIRIAQLQNPIPIPPNIIPWTEDFNMEPRNILNLAMGFNGINTAIIVGKPPVSSALE